MSIHRITYESGRDLVIDTCDRLRLARIKAGLEQDEIAEILGVSTSTVSNWECGRTKAKLPFIAAWAQVTGYNMASLVNVDVELAAQAAESHAEPPEGSGGGVREAPAPIDVSVGNGLLLPRMDSNHQPCDSLVEHVCEQVKPPNVNVVKRAKKVSHPVG